MKASATCQTCAVNPFSDYMFARAGGALCVLVHLACVQSALLFPRQMLQARKSMRVGAHDIPFKHPLFAGAVGAANEVSNSLMPAVMLWAQF